MNLTNQQLAVSNLAQEARQLIMKIELVLQQLIPSPPASLTADQQQKVKLILKVVEKRFGVPSHRVLDRTKEQHVVDARHAAMWLVARGMALDNLRIARIFRRDRKLVIHAIKRMNDLLANEPAFNETMRLAQKDLGMKG